MSAFFVAVGTCDPFAIRTSRFQKYRYKFWLLAFSRVSNQHTLLCMIYFHDLFCRMLWSRLHLDITHLPLLSHSADHVKQINLSSLNASALNLRIMELIIKRVNCFYSAIASVASQYWGRVLHLFKLLRKESLWGKHHGYGVIIHACLSLRNDLLFRLSRLRNSVNGHHVRHLHVSCGGNGIIALHLIV